MSAEAIGPHRARGARWGWHCHRRRPRRSPSRSPTRRIRGVYEDVRPRRSGVPTDRV